MLFHVLDGRHEDLLIPSGPGNLLYSTLPGKGAYNYGAVTEIQEVHYDSHFGTRSRSANEFYTSASPVFFRRA